MKLNRTAGWPLLLLTPLLLSVRTQQAIPGNSHTTLSALPTNAAQSILPANTGRSVSPTRPASMARHQRLLANQLWVLIQQAEDWQQGTRPAGGHVGGGLYGTGNIALPMACVVKE